MNDPITYPYYRQGRSQKRNMYRHDTPGDEAGTYIGVCFEPENAHLAVKALNWYTAAMSVTGAHVPAEDIQARYDCSGCDACRDAPVPASEDAWNRFMAMSEEPESPGDVIPVITNQAGTPILAGGEACGAADIGGECPPFQDMVVNLDLLVPIYTDNPRFGYIPQSERDKMVTTFPDRDFEVAPRWVWLVASALEPGSRAHAVSTLAVSNDTSTYRELLLTTACSPATPKSLILTDEGPGEFTQCARCVRALERKPE